MLFSQELKGEQDMGKKDKLWGALIFLCVFLWMLTLIQGLPLIDPDDWDHVLAAKDLSWKTLLTNLLTPWSTSERWVGQVERLDEVTHRRMFLSIILKASHQLFGLKFLPYYIFSKAIFFAGTLTLLFLLISKMTSMRSYAFLSLLFFITIPAHYIHALWISPSDTMVHFFLLLGVALFLLILSNLEHKKPFSQFLLYLSGFLIVGWIAMKTKETALILPLSLTIYTFLQTRRLGNQKLKLTLLLLILGFLIFLVVPIPGVKTHAGLPLRFNPHTVARLFFLNYHCGWEDEMTSAFFSREQIWPVSVARTFGFYSLWTLVLGVALYGVIRIRAGKNINPLFIRHPLVQISMIWLLCEAFFLGNFQADPRYFSGTMIPITILSVRLIYCVVYQLRGLSKLGFLSLVILSLSSSVFENFQHVLFLRLQYGKRARYALETAKTIYQDVYPSEPYDLGKILLSGAAAYVPSLNTQRISHRIFYSPFGYGMWKRTDERTIEAFEKFSKDGAIYDVSYKDERLPRDPRIKNIATIYPVNKGSLLESILYPLKGKKIHPLYVDKWIGGEGTSSTANQRRDE